MSSRNVVLQSITRTGAVIDIDAYPTPLVNSIRRSLLNHVRSVAMVAEPNKSSSIRIIKNTSRLNNQFLSLRLSLIPVCLSPPEHGGEVNILDRYEIRISKQATEPGITNLTTNDIRIYDTKEKGFLPTSIVSQMFPRETVEHPGLTHNSNPIMIVPLKGPHGEKEGESIDIVAKLKVGVGSTHACFVPVCNSAYEIIPIDPDAPSATFDLMGKGDNSRFRFTIETISNRNPEVLFLEGIDEIIRKLVNVRTSIGTAIRSKGKGPNCEIHTDHGDLVLRFMNEDHTLGTLLQEYLLRKVKQDDPESLSDWFVGYRMPHPLTPEMIVRIRIPSKMSNTDLNVTMTTLGNDWILPAIVSIENDLKEIGSVIAALIPEERKVHPLTMILNDDYVPAVERPVKDPESSSKLLLHNVREPVSPEE